MDLNISLQVKTNRTKMSTFFFSLLLFHRSFQWQHATKHNQCVPKKQPCFTPKKGKRLLNKGGGALSCCHDYSWKRVIYLDSENKITTSLTSFLTAFLIATIRAVILTIASPWQPDTASSSTAELVSCAHGCGCGHTHTHTHVSFFNLRTGDWRHYEWLLCSSINSMKSDKNDRNNSKMEIKRD